MRDRIVVATDLSEKSNIAIQKAIDIAKKYDLWLHVLHVINPPVFKWAWGSEIIDENKQHSDMLKKKSEEISHKISDELQRKHDKLHIDIRIGDPSEEIIAYAKAKKANAIILGDVGAYHPLGEFMLGTTTTNVIQESHLPVLIARNSDSIEYKKILIPTDFSDDSKETVEYVSDLFPDATLYLLNVMEIPKEYKLKYYGLTEDEIENLKEVNKLKNESNFNSFLDTLKIENSIEKLTATGSLKARMVLEEGRDIMVDLIALHSHKIGNITSRIVGNIATDIIKQSKRDVLVYQNRD